MAFSFDDHPPVGFDDLCLMLELEIAMGRTKDFRRRLKQALETAFAKGRGY
ncbi:MAG: hypothetical protein WDO70_11915 [Alphaproteobacteria bacterium]